MAGGSATSGVLCRYFLHGACKFGSQCAFSHSMEDAESQVCRFYLKGECAYGDRCRYLHTKPEWGRRQDSSAPSTSYAAPKAPRPAADDLTKQLPISRLRLGGQAPDAGRVTGDGSSGSAQIPLPVRLPRDPFGSSGRAVGAAGAAAPQHSEAEGAGWQGGDAEEWGDYESNDDWDQDNEDWWEEEGYGEEAGWSDGEGEGDEFGPGSGSHQQPGSGGAPGASEQPQAWALPSGDQQQQQWAASSHPLLRSLCMQWFSTGACSKGDRCHLAHGEQCEHCRKYALHPTDTAAREQHLAECRLRHERLAARARSATVECGICLEQVLSKAVPGDRRFGLLTGCDHPFCLRCIRSWRQKMDGGADVDTALRTCPVCRVTSHFIVPSLVWPTSSEEKERIVAGYKAKLSTVDCRYFAFGDGTCPFSTSCFYRHAYPDGRLEDKSLRKAADEEGTIRVMQPVRLSDFIALSTAGQRVLGGGRRR